MTGGVAKLGVIVGGTPPQIAGEVLQDGVHTPWGNASAPLFALRLGDRTFTDILVLNRHGVDHDLNPHQVNYRANMWLLHAAGVRHVVATNTVGGIDASLPVGGLVLPDQLIDYTWGRASTYDDRRRHVDFTRPYDSALSAQVVLAMPEIVRGGTYGCTQGPRLETAAEIRRMARDGCTIVGMTGMPEAVLARELEIAYASVCLVVNPAAGLGGESVDMQALYATAAAGGERIMAMLASLAHGLGILPA